MTDKFPSDEYPTETGPVAIAQELRRRRDVVVKLMDEELESFPDIAHDQQFLDAFYAVQQAMPKEADVIIASIERCWNEFSELLNALHLRGYFDCELDAIRSSENAAKAVAAKIEKDLSGKHGAMRAIRDEWKRRRDAGMTFKATAFAKEMAKKHRDIVTAEAIKNAQTRWNQEYHPSS